MRARAASRRPALLGALLVLVGGALMPCPAGALAGDDHVVPASARLEASAAVVGGPVDELRPVDPVPAPGSPDVVPVGVSLDLARSATAPPPKAGTPVRVDIPSIGVHAAVESLGLDADGTRQAPPRFDTVGWYVDTPRPGDAGPSVLAGHVDSFRGPAVFFHLDRLHAGDLVTVADDAVVRAFRVDSVARYPKDRFPTSLVFGPVPDSELRLVTCGGQFDRARHRYLDNVVVFLHATAS